MDLFLIIVAAMALLLLLVPSIVLLLAVRAAVRAAELVLSRPATSAPTPAITDPSGFEPAGVAASAGARDPGDPFNAMQDANDNLDLFSDLVPSMGRSSANDPTGPSGCARCARTRRLISRLTAPMAARAFKKGKRVVAAPTKNPPLN